MIYLIYIRLNTHKKPEMFKKTRKNNKIHK